MRRAGAFLAVAMLAACSSNPEAMRSDWEIENAAMLAKEATPDALPTLPPFPAAGNLVEFQVDGLTGFRAFIDANSLAVGDGIVRYSLVARSASGAENTTYEALNCRSGEHRLYASGRADLTWVMQSSPWREVDRRRPIQRALMRDYFCPARTVISTSTEAIAALRRGGHPAGEARSPFSVPR